MNANVEMKKLGRFVLLSGLMVVEFLSFSKNPRLPFPGKQKDRRHVNIICTVIMCQFLLKERLKHESNELYNMTMSIKNCTP